MKGTYAVASIVPHTNGYGENIYYHEQLKNEEVNVGEQKPKYQIPARIAHKLKVRKKKR